MARTFNPLSPFRAPSPALDPDRPENRFAMEALARHKREGMELAVRARTIAMLVVAVMISFLAPWPQVIYYHVILALFVLIGFAQQRVGRVGASPAEMGLMLCDLALMTVVAVVPNPFDGRGLPLAFQFQFDTHKYFFLVLAMATLSYSWRTIFAVGTWTTVLWAVGVLGMAYLAQPDPGIATLLADYYPDAPVIAYLADPTEIALDQRVQEGVVFLLCAVILAVSMRRFQNLLLAQAEIARERANLARYFSPNVVDRLSHNDEPLKQVSTQDIAVMFVDIVGFTPYAATRPPHEVIATLREFHGLMEAEVFRHEGTLDKYLGDGLMATFGTPVAGPGDAANALACVWDMLAATDRWNAQRRAAGEPEIRASIGVHYGEVVLGDIGANRLEFAVIGNTVNVASRLEAMTRPLGVRAVVSDDLVRAANGDGSPPDGFTRHGDQAVRGLDRTICVWSLG